MGSYAYVIILFFNFIFPVFIYLFFIFLVGLHFFTVNGSDDSTVSVTICCLSMKHDNS